MTFNWLPSCPSWFDPRRGNSVSAVGDEVPLRPRLNAPGAATLAAQSVVCIEGWENGRPGHAMTVPPDGTQ